MKEQNKSYTIITTIIIIIAIVTVLLTYLQY